MAVATIDIAIRTYNCAHWLGDLFASIVSQDFADWRIVARDDASSDATPQLLVEWKAKLGERMKIVEDGRGNLGMIGNCDAVLQATDAPYVMLADPDDLYLPGKFSKTLAAIKKLEAESSATTPALVCSDCRIVDGQLKTTAESYWRWCRLEPGNLMSFRHMLMESSAINTTILINRALLELAAPIEGIRYPDWWLALNACAFGRIHAIAEPTILYRRHGANDTDAPLTASMGSALMRVAEARRRLHALVGVCAQQAAVFERRHAERLTPEQRTSLRAMASLAERGFFARRAAIVREGLWFASPIKNAGLLALM